MNIVFWVLVVFAAIILWLALSSVFWDIGDFFSSLVNGAKEAMEETDENEEED